MATMRSLLIKLVPKAALPFAERNPDLTLRQLPSKQQVRSAAPPLPLPWLHSWACARLARTEPRRLRAQPPADAAF